MNILYAEQKTNTILIYNTILIKNNYLLYINIKL